MIKDFEITRPSGTYGESVGKYFDEAINRFSSIGLIVGSCTFDACKGVTFAKVCDPSTIIDIDNSLQNLHSIGLSIESFSIEDNGMTLRGVVDTYDW